MKILFEGWGIGRMHPQMHLQATLYLYCTYLGIFGGGRGEHALVSYPDKALYLR